MPKQPKSPYWWIASPRPHDGGKPIFFKATCETEAKRTARIALQAKRVACDPCLMAPDSPMLCAFVGDVPVYVNYRRGGL